MPNDAFGVERAAISVRRQAIQRMYANESGETAATKDTSAVNSTLPPSNKLTQTFARPSGPELEERRSNDDLDPDEQIHAPVKQPPFKIRLKKWLIHGLTGK